MTHKAYKKFYQCGNYKLLNDKDVYVYDIKPCPVKQECLTVYFEYECERGLMWSSNIYDEIQNILQDFKPIDGRIEGASMTQILHSPEPWEIIEGNEHHGIYIEDQAGNTVCDLYFMDKCGIFHHPYNANDSAKHNAQIIAAAPEMLDALEEFTNCIESEGEAFTAYSKARKAIEKARGKSCF